LRNIHPNVLWRTIFVTLSSHTYTVLTSFSYFLSFTHTFLSFFVCRFLLTLIYTYLHYLLRRRWLYFLLQWVLFLSLIDHSCPHPSVVSSLVCHNMKHDEMAFRFYCLTEHCFIFGLASSHTISFRSLISKPFGMTKQLHLNRLFEELWWHSPTLFLCKLCAEMFFWRMKKIKRDWIFRWSLPCAKIICQTPIFISEPSNSQFSSFDQAVITQFLLSAHRCLDLTASLQFFFPFFCYSYFCYRPQILTALPPHFNSQYSASNCLLLFNI
jgi:hypothetical protein